MYYIYIYIYIYIYKNFVHKVGNQPMFVVEILFREKFESVQLEDLKIY